MRTIFSAQITMNGQVRTHKAQRAGDRIRQWSALAILGMVGNFVQADASPEALPDALPKTLATPKTVDVALVAQIQKFLGNNADVDTRHASPHQGGDPHGQLNADQYARVAISHLDEGRSMEAMGTLNKALGKYPEDAQLFAVRSQTYAMAGQFSEALNDIEQALKKAPDNPHYLVNRAMLYSKFDRDIDALADLDRAIALQPEFLAGHFNRGALRYIREDYTGALKDFEQCIVLDPHTAAPYFNRAAVYDALGMPTEAIADLERFLQLTDSEAWMQAAQNLLQQWKNQAGLSGPQQATDETS